MRKSGFAAAAGLGSLVLLLTACGGSSGSSNPASTSTTGQATSAALKDIGVTDDRVHFELFEAGHMGIDYRYPVSLAWLCSRMTP